VGLHENTEEVLVDANRCGHVTHGRSSDICTRERCRTLHLLVLLGLGAIPVRILGISAFYHNGAAALVRDGEIVAAAQEDRFSQKKYD